MKKKLPNQVSWSLRILLVLVIIFVIYNFIRDRNVEKIDQSATPSNEQIEQQILNKPEIIQKSGEFIGSGNYSVEGRASVVLFNDIPTLKFDESFSSTVGPDLEVYLSKNKVASGEELGEFVSLKKLQSIKGAQTYTLPTDFEQFNSVVIWCRAFNSKFGAADLI